MDCIDLNGKWNVELSDGSKWTALFPGTLDGNSIGYKDTYHTKLHQDENYIENVSLSNESLIATRFTRKYTYEGEAFFSRIFKESFPEGKRLFIDAERARSLRLFIDGCEIEKIRGTLSTPYCFEVTDFLHKGSEIKFISDNSYKGMPHDDILYSSAATDETQTNWNGITGYLRIRTEEKDFVEEIKVFTDKDYKARVKVYVNSQNGYDGSIYIKSDAFRNDININVKTLRGRTEIEIRDIELIEGIKFWDEYKGNLYNVEVRLKSYEDTPAVSGFFGVRYFGDDGHGHFQLNGRRIFLRSEANCAVYPEKGHPDTEVEEWEQIIKTYKAYGVNLLRFHSHCPPDAAFTAADKLGMLMQPELSNWNPKNAFGSDESRNYYEKELFEIINVYGNHPSFVMLTFGNELQADESGMSYMHELLEQCHELDDTRLYAIGSNAFYGEKGCDSASDFYTSMRYKGLDLRATFDGMKGYLNNEYPSAVKNYDNTMNALRKEYSKPVFSFEVGQYEVLPDFDEIQDFKGVTVPDNYKLIQDKVINKGMSDSWKRRVEATGELSLLCYREEVEAALRTEDFSGISLLGLQDFPGQGTALVGMLNSHLKSKPYSFASPERFSSFFTQVLPLIYLEKYTYINTEKLKAVVKLANYSDKDITGRLEYSLLYKTDDECGLGKKSDEECSLPSKSDDEECAGFFKKWDLQKDTCALKGKLTDIGTIEIDLEFIKHNSRLDIEVSFSGYKNTYPIWVYDEKSLEKAELSSVYETRVIDDKAKEILENGGKVYFSPDMKTDFFSKSVKSTFSTDFWSVGTFATQEGSMGLLIDKEHPVFKDFPTEFHTNYQWWIMAGQRAFILPEGAKSIVTVLDSYAYMRNMGLLCEFKCLNGKLLVSGMNLSHYQKYPECRALQASIYRYMESEEFNPEEKIGLEYFSVDKKISR